MSSISAYITITSIGSFISTAATFTAVTASK
jgi:hypothetical protein